MAIVTISRGSYGKGRDVAEKVADRLGYECLSRDVLLEASDTFNVPEVKLVRALRDAPKVLDRFTHGKRKYVAYIQEALLKRVQKDNVVYHGLAGQFFLMGVDHAVKVRIIADMYDRIRLEMARENISADEARRVLQKDDEERRKWAVALYGIDTHDPALYDLVLHVRKLSVHDAADLICHTAKLPQFRATPQSQKALDNLVLAARVRNTIIDKHPIVEVTANNGAVVVVVDGTLELEGVIRDRVLEATDGILHAKDVHVHVRPAGFE